MKINPFTKPLAIAGMLAAALVSQAIAKPLKVFILSGQSNMQGMGGVSTFPHIAMNPKTAPMLKDMQDASGNPVVLDDVYISYLSGDGGFRNGKGSDLVPNEKDGKLTVGFGAEYQGPRIGPEFTFGIYMHKQLNEPFLIIKTAWGGRSLSRDFRPPSSIPDELNLDKLENATDESTKNDIKETGMFYRLMMEHVRKVLSDPKKYHPAYNEKDGYEIAGFVWFQGYNDMVDGRSYPNRTTEGGFDLYTELLAKMIRDIRIELKTPDLPVVVGVIGMDGPSTPEKEAKKDKRSQGIMPNFRHAQAATAELPEFKGTVSAVHTDQFWDDELGQLDSRYASIRYKAQELAKQEKLSRQDANKLHEKMIAEGFTEQELKTYKLGRASQSFHYYGSAKIYGQIGKAFAESMAGLLK